jgi:hypothetical protein
MRYREGLVSLRVLSLAALAVLAACASPTAAPRTAGLPEYPPPVAPAARPAPVAPAAPAAVIGNIAGTRWSGIDSDKDHYLFEFRRDGSLHYESPSGKYDDGSWKQSGQRIEWEVNDHYAEYEATLESASRMTGSAHNKAGHTWTFTLDKGR